MFLEDEMLLELFERREKFAKKFTKEFNTQLTNGVTHLAVPLPNRYGDVAGWCDAVYQFKVDGHQGTFDVGVIIALDRVQELMHRIKLCTQYGVSLNGRSISFDRLCVYIDSSTFSLTELDQVKKMLSTLNILLLTRDQIKY